MAFSIHLMVNSSSKEVLDKELSTIETVTGTLREGTSIVDPVIKIEGDLSRFTKCNYMFIPEFGRYYYVTDIKSVINNIVEFSAHVDVLTTYKDQIRSNVAIIHRQENDWNLYLNDGVFKVYQNPMVLTKAFPAGFTTQELVLAVAGG